MDVITWSASAVLNLVTTAELFGKLFLFLPSLARMHFATFSCANYSDRLCTDEIYIILLFCTCRTRTRRGDYGRCSRVPPCVLWHEHRLIAADPRDAARLVAPPERPAVLPQPVVAVGANFAVRQVERSELLNFLLEPYGSSSSSFPPFELRLTILPTLLRPLQSEALGIGPSSPTNSEKISFAVTVNCVSRLVRLDRTIIV